jgi:DNA (cytosine-5)-methyltransferase 1
VNPPGRRQEDDVNLVAAFYPTGGTHGLHDYRDGTTPPMKVGSGVGAPAGIAITQADAAVRRLTPVECERLQGFPDNWTRLNDKTPDSRRYAALGDAVTVPVAHWIGRRLA